MPVSALLGRSLSTSRSVTLELNASRFWAFHFLHSDKVIAVLIMSHDNIYIHKYVNHSIFLPTNSRPAVQQWVCSCKCKYCDSSGEKCYQHTPTRPVQSFSENSIPCIWRTICETFLSNSCKFAPTNHSIQCACLFVVQSNNSEQLTGPRNFELLS